MLMYPEFDPIALHIGPIKVHWYGLMYAVGFLGGWWLGRLRAREGRSAITVEQMDDYIMYVALGVVLGGRIGYMLVYGLDTLLANPLSLFKVWEGGMSFHGGMLGVFLGSYLFARRVGRRFFEITDFVAPLVTIGLGAGRIGNFINGELWGAPTTLPWGMVYPPLGMEPRHPSQLYEFALEGIVLFTILWLYSRKPRPVGATSGLFLICYGSFRFLVELVRLPDPQIGYIAFGWLTMGQLLSLPMIVGGIWLFTWAHRHHRRNSESAAVS